VPVKQPEILSMQVNLLQTSPCSDIYKILHHLLSFPNLTHHRPRAQHLYLLGHQVQAKYISVKV